MINASDCHVWIFIRILISHFIFTSLFVIRREGFIMFTLKNEQQRFEESLDVLTAVVAKLHEKVKQAKNL